MNKKFWFKRKRYGWGWTPSSTEGWVVLAVYVLILVLFLRFVKTDPGSVYLLVSSFTAILLFVCYLTGEKPRWQWEG
jgi:hypothetical protein